MKQGTQEWFDARKAMITGSRVGAILGLSPFQTRDDVMRSMVRDYLGAPSEQEDSPALTWGIINEDTAKALLELLTERKIKDCGFYKFNDYIGASPDGLIGDDIVVEIKCPYFLRNEDKPEFKSIHEMPHYYAQVQIEMLSTNRKRCLFFQWTPYSNKQEIIHYDNDWITSNIPKLEQFRKVFLEEIQQPNCQKHLEDKEIHVTDDYLLELAKRYELAKARQKKAATEMKELKEQLIEVSKAGKTTIFNDTKVYQATRKGSVNYDAILNDYGVEVDKEKYRSKGSTYWVVL
jgi:putative phage-type endonuclease